MVFNNILQSELIERQIINILNNNFTSYYSGKDYYNFRCNICGDSKINKYKKRGYLLKKDGKWYYYCHNGGCNASMTAISWMKEYFPLNYKDYIRELLKEKKEKNEKDFSNIFVKKTPVVVNKYTNQSKLELEQEKENIKYFIPILKGKEELFNKAIKICNDRLISSHIWNKWFVAVGGRYKDRIIIPFYNDTGKIYYWQGRAIYDNIIPKYLSRKGSQLNCIYNYYTVDRSKPVIILEGLIDSLFIENSIALTGFKFNNKKLDIFEKKYWLFDSDNDGRNNSLKMLQKGEQVFCWNKFIKNNNLPQRDKWDINDVCIYLKRNRPFSFEELKPYFTNSIFDKICFII